MPSDKIIQQLHENEKKIIKSLKAKKLYSDQLAKATKLSKEAVEKAAEWAKQKNLVSIKEDVSEFLELTIEGQEYSKTGLPEKRLLSAISRGMNEIEVLKNKIPQFSIGLVWINKNGWAEVKEGKLLITEYGKESLNKKLDEEDLLAKISKGPKTSKDFKKDVVEKLIRRGLIKIRTEVKREYSLTAPGKKIEPQIKLGKEIGQITVDTLKKSEWKKYGLRAYNVATPAARIHPAKKHFMTQVIEYIRKVWTEMGFKEMSGPLLEVSFWNFDALYQPQDHPARDLADTFYMKIPSEGELPEPEITEAVKATHEYGWTCNSLGWQYKWDPIFAKKSVLRTHTTTLSVRTLAQLRKDVEKGALPTKYFAVGRTFRNETIDWKHLAEFNQTEGIVVGEDVNFKHLLGYLREFFARLGFERARFRPAYFPYVEEATEIEVWHPEHKKWVELGGSGIFRPEVVKPLLRKDVPVLAWGLAVERLVMLNYKMENIRDLYWNDLKVLRESKIWLR